MKIVWSIIIIVHGLIHVMGFVKAFELAEVSELSKYISKPIGVLWLLACVLFLVTSLLYILDRPLWPVLGIIAILLSQILLFVSWGDAKYGTVINLIILLVCIAGYGKIRFENTIIQEVTSLLKVSAPAVKESYIPDIDSAGLPPIVKKWLQYTGVTENEPVQTVYLEQTGEMKTEPKGEWMPFAAKQYYRLPDASFIWTVNVESGSLLQIQGRDKLINGENEMLIVAYHLFPIVKEGYHDKINRSGMTRYLAEICLFPQAALYKNIQWESLSANSAKGTLTSKNTEVSGIFTFTDTGELIAFESKRFYGGATDAQLQNWLVEIQDYRDFNGYRLPASCKITWKLPEGDFECFRIKIAHIEYNRKAF
ncbi:DUF6544 family protein [Ascidiimonas aurantiaca]|uniref:DUF6544 family protein n=1 Tax=Ascidiimonas aurantiaca TaxID=1685432 RepID=UPI0030ECB890